MQMLSPFGRRYEVRMLNRDARYVVEDALGRFADERVAQMANATRQYLKQADEQLALPHLGHENVLLHFQNLHRTARREQQDMALSALTLVVIYLRAQRHGEACALAIKAVRDFVEEWASQDEANAPTGRAGRLEA